MKPIGIVLSSMSWCKGEWVGLTLITGIRSLFNEMLSERKFEILQNTFSETYGNFF